MGLHLPVTEILLADIRVFVSEAGVFIYRDAHLADEKIHRLRKNKLDLQNKKLHYEQASILYRLDQNRAYPECFLISYRNGF